MEQEKPREPARPAPEPTLGVAVHRCPFCHERVGVDDGGWVGCASCLARHHASCWDEHGACAACRHGVRLVPEPPRPAPGPPRHLARQLAVLAVVLVALAVVLGLYTVAQRRREADEREVMEMEFAAIEQARREDARAAPERSAQRRAQLERSAAREQETREQAARERELERATPAAGQTLELLVRDPPPGDVGYTLRLEEAPAGLARSKSGGLYTRYADDLAFSGDQDFAAGASRFRDLVQRIAAAEGFELHSRKDRRMRRSARQRLGGLVVNARPAPARDEFDRLEAILHNCARRGPASQNRDGHADFRAHLRGRVAWFEHASPARGAKLRACFDRIAW